MSTEDQSPARPGGFFNALTRLESEEDFKRFNDYLWRSHDDSLDLDHERPLHESDTAYFDVPLYDDYSEESFP
jgi:hypothetical protein